MNLSLRDQLSLEVQSVISQVLFVFFGPIMWCIFRYKFNFTVDDVESLRAQYCSIKKRVTGPLLICTNHLTLVDSIIQTMILSSISGYLLKPSSFAWNLPEKSNFSHKVHWRIICYLGKCIPVVRGSSSVERNRSMEKMRYILNKGEVISIFPEGKRSRDGLVDDKDFSYGVGQLLQAIPEAQILCIYLRGIKKGGFSKYPIKGERFHLQMQMYKPFTKEKGRRAGRELSRQIVHQLKLMEREFFLCNI